MSGAILLWWLWQRPPKHFVLCYQIKLRSADDQSRLKKKKRIKITSIFKKRTNNKRRKKGDIQHMLTSNKRSQSWSQGLDCMEETAPGSRAAAAARFTHVDPTRGTSPSKWKHKLSLPTPRWTPHGKGGRLAFDIFLVVSIGFMVSKSQPDVQYRTGTHVRGALLGQD